jgi:hypothetical protein
MEHIVLLLTLVLLSGPPSHGWRQEVGRLSVYFPGDGQNRGKLACGGEFTHAQVHIAYREWWRVGCGRRVLVCTEETGRCALAKVMDAGPFGIYTGELKHARREGRWQVHTSSRPPPIGWRYRAAADLSIALWEQLGRPRSLSRVSLTFLPRDAVWGRFLEQVSEFWRPPPVS